MMSWDDLQNTKRLGFAMVLIAAAIAVTMINGLLPELFIAPAALAAAGLVVGLTAHLVLAIRMRSIHRCGGEALRRLMERKGTPQPDR